MSGLILTDDGDVEFGGGLFAKAIDGGDGKRVSAGGIRQLSGEDAGLIRIDIGIIIDLDDAVGGGLTLDGDWRSDDTTGRGFGDGKRRGGDEGAAGRAEGGGSRGDGVAGGSGAQ